MNDISTDLRKYYSLEQQAEKGILPSSLTMSQIAQLWCQIDGLPLEGTEKLRYDLSMEMEDAIRKYLNALEAGKGIPEDALVIDDEPYQICLDAWRARWQNEDDFFGAFVSEPIIRKDNFECWAREVGKCGSVLMSKLKGWFNGTTLGLKDEESKERAKRKSSLDEEWCRAESARYQREFPDKSREEILAHVIKKAPLKLNGKRYGDKQIEDWIRGTLPGYVAGQRGPKPKSKK